MNKILLTISILLFALTFLFVAYTENQLVDENTTCFDRQHNEMQGVTCIDKVHPSVIINFLLGLTPLFAFTAVLLGILSVLDTGGKK